jgi:hypothetical protein
MDEIECSVGSKIYAALTVCLHFIFIRFQHISGVGFHSFHKLYMYHTPSLTHPQILNFCTACTAGYRGVLASTIRL